jgi:signal transduction histidine kinase
MQRVLAILLLLLAGLFPSTGAPVDVALTSLSIPQLEQRLTEIDSELEQLASYTLRGGVGSVGYRSDFHRQPDVREAVRIELNDEALVDQIVLVPVLYRDSATGVRSEGFPVAFRILAGTAGITNEIAVFSKEHHLPPRIAPLVVSFPPINASWVAIEVTTLTPLPNHTNLHNFQLSELLVFSGMENVALPLQQPPGTPTPAVPFRNPRHPRFLTDGFMPYLMDAAHGSPNETQLLRVESPLPLPTLTLDLGSTVSVSQVNLHTADVGRSIPMVEASSWAVPRHVRVTGATRPDFADAIALCEYNQKSIYDNGPIIMRRFPEAHCRYIRFSILDTRPVAFLRDENNEIAFAEIEVLSKSQNIARGVPVIPSSNLTYRKNALERMTDGNNYYGQVLPIREWMNQLARRHDLEAERPLVLAGLNRGYARQQTNLRRMIWLATLLAAGTAIAILIQRLISLRRLDELRTRFAADLHDELGANVHTIGLLSDAAKVAHDSPDEWQMLHQRIRTLSTRTGLAIRNFANIVNTEGLYQGLVQDMRRAEARILAQFDHSTDIRGEEFLGRLPLRTHVDLFLFYKECLINICRHADATRADTQLTVTPRKIILTVSDNGKGLSGKSLPVSLKRRARLLRAKLTVEENTEGGTSICLQLRHRSGGECEKPGITDRAAS